MGSNWKIDNSVKKKLIEKLTSMLTTLRNKANISQAELANIIGMSRQTYGTIERGTHKMSWNAFLSILFYFFVNIDTRDYVYESLDLASNINKLFNGGNYLFSDAYDEILGKNKDHIMSSLDSQALNSIKTIILIEYARCTSASGEDIIKVLE